MYVKKEVFFYVQRELIFYMKSDWYHSANHCFVLIVQSCWRERQIPSCFRIMDWKVYTALNNVSTAWWMMMMCIRAQNTDIISIFNHRDGDPNTDLCHGKLCPCNNIRKPNSESNKCKRNIPAFASPKHAGGPQVEKNEPML